MHITRYTDYSLRVLIYLAVQGDRLATIQEIAARLVPFLAAGMQAEDKMLIPLSDSHAPVA